jgi:hypothetical protein
MATRNMGYDHAQYLVAFQASALGVAGNAITGSATNTVKYSAFTNLLVKSITTYATVIGTSIDTPLLLFRLTGNGTTAVNTITCTYTFGTPLGSAAYFANSVLNTASAVGTSGATTVTLTGGSGGANPYIGQGDMWFIQKGTDATDTVGYSVELVVAPLSNVTAP